MTETDDVIGGSCYGFFGRHGAGKTTTIKCDRPTGRVDWRGLVPVGVHDPGGRSGQPLGLPAVRGSDLVPLSACNRTRIRNGRIGVFMDMLGRQIVMLEAALQASAGAADVTPTVENGAILTTAPR
jgi:hypothetical protein